MAFLDIVDVLLKDSMKGKYDVDSLVVLVNDTVWEVEFWRAEKEWSKLKKNCGLETHIVTYEFLQQQFKTVVDVLLKGAMEGKVLY